MRGPLANFFAQIIPAGTASRSQGMALQQRCDMTCRYRMRWLAGVLLCGCAVASHPSVSSYARSFAVDERNLVVAVADGRILRLEKSDGRMRVLATGQDPWSIALDRSSAYWVTSSAMLRAVAIEGGPVRDVAQLQDLSSVVADESGAYWVDRDHVMHVGADGRVVTLAQARVDLHALALDDQAIYWVSCGIAVMRLDKAGGAPLAIAGDPRDVGDCAATKSGPEECQYMCETITVDDQMAYWQDDDRLMRVPKRGGRPEVLASGFSMRSIAVDDEMIYMSIHPRPPSMYSYCSGEVIAIPKQSPGSKPTLVHKSCNPQGLALASHHVYWLTEWVNVRPRLRRM
jgi:hypothetical protein